MTDPKETARRFVADVTGVWGDRLRSVVLHGSVARGDAIPGVSDINLLLLVDTIRMEDLAAAGPLARRWVELGNSPPMVLDAADWAHASDAFAMEVSDMLDHRDVLLGDDPLAGVSVSPDALRLQLETELRGAVVRLHEELMLSASEPDEVGALLLRALPSFQTYMRATLRVAGRPVPEEGDEVVREAARTVGGDPSAFLEARRSRRSGSAPDRSLSHPEVEGYYRLMERTVRYVDGLDRHRKTTLGEESEK
ncbi:MAG: nucleotidyltransferase domain-containing protein [Gemmatimonadota bacterium]